MSSNTCDEFTWRRTNAVKNRRERLDAIDESRPRPDHDGIGPGARRDDVSETIAFTELAVAHARSHGIELTALT